MLGLLRALSVLLLVAHRASARSWPLDGNMATGFNSPQIRDWFGAIGDPRLVAAARDVLHAGARHVFADLSVYPLPVVSH